MVRSTCMEIGDGRRPHPVSIRTPENCAAPRLATAPPAAAAAGPRAGVGVPHSAAEAKADRQGTAPASLCCRLGQPSAPDAGWPVRDTGTAVRTDRRRPRGNTKHVAAPEKPT